MPSYSGLESRKDLRLELTTLALLLLGFLAALLMTHPFANVLYGGDDWAYAWSVKTLLSDGKLQASDWVSASAVPQILWGTSFAYFFGLSCRTLNASTMVAATAGVFIIYGLCRLLGATRATGAIVTLVLATTPLYLGFAGSFMTDMFYTVLMVASLFVYVVASQRQSFLFALLGGFLAALAFLTRQIGITIPAAFAFTLLLSCLYRGTDRKRRLILVAAGCLAPLATLLIYFKSPELLGGRTKAQLITLGIKNVLRRQMNWALTLEHLYLTVLYLLVLLLPIFILLGCQKREKLAEILRRQLIPFLLVAVLSTGYCFWRMIAGEPLLVRGDSLHTQTYGASPVSGSIKIWMMLCVVASVTFAVLVTVGWDHFRHDRKALFKEKPAGLFFLSLCFVFHLLLTVSFLTFFNEYFLPLLPMAAIFCAVQLGQFDKILSIPAIVLALLMTAGSVLLLDSHLRFVEANYQIADGLVRNGANSSRISAHPSWYGWHHYDELMGDFEKNFDQGKGFRNFSIFRRVLDQSEYALRNQREPPVPPDDWVLFERRWYSTLHGKEPLDIWRHR